MHSNDNIPSNEATFHVNNIPSERFRQAYIRLEKHFRQQFVRQHVATVHEATVHEAAVQEATLGDSSRGSSSKVQQSTIAQCVAKMLWLNLVGHKVKQ